MTFALRRPATLLRVKDCVLTIASGRTAPGKRRPPPASCIGHSARATPNVPAWAAAASRQAGIMPAQSSTRRSSPGSSPARADPLDELTEREREVLALVAEGLSNRAIAARLFVTERTIEAHVKQVFLKLGLSTDPDSHRRVLAVLAYLRSMT